MLRFSFVIFLLFIYSLPAEELSFNEQILPILSDKCFHCHGPDDKHRKAKLRLDTFEGAIKKNKKGKAAIVPGNPEKSLLIKLIKTDDEDDIMPPEDTGKNLTKEEITLLTRWVKEGAKYERHWAFTEPKKAKLPSIKNSNWPLKEFDHYILSKMEKNDLNPNKDAAPHTLIRRVHLDLTGLPPEPEIVKAFVLSPSKEHFEKIVDKLLASDAYAERMAMVWMDAARYSDSDGFQQDKTRNNWPWKDWVINAYKNNMPFDRFTIEQLAGDLLPNATQEQKLATAFNRHHMTNGEGGRDPEESRIDYVMDRVNTLGTVWMGLTLGCAQCHTHKFDPVTHKNYYQMNAFFNSIDEDGKAGKGAKPYLSYTPILSNEGLKDAEDWQAHVKDKENSIINDAMKGFDKWLSKKAHTVTKVTNFSSWKKVIATNLKTMSGSNLEQAAEGEFSVSGKNSLHEDYTVTSSPNLKQITGLRIKVKPDGKTFSKDKDGHIILTNLKIFIRSKSTGVQKSVQFGGAIATYENKGKDWKKYGPVKGILDDDPRTGWTTTGSEFDKEHTLQVYLAKAEALDDDKEVVIELRHRSLAGFKNIRRFSLELTDEFGQTARRFEKTASESLAELKGKTSKLSGKYHSLFKDEFLSSQAQVVAAKADTFRAINQVRYYKNSAKKKNVMTMQERKTPRKTHILIRGEWNKKGEEVTPGVPEEILAWPKGLKKDRLGLAKWLIDKKNPMTARVTVNRYWQMIFGAGIVRTPEDFGLQGERPTHTKVIDWLAVEFMENNWNVKHILKTIVMSRTYRLSSQADKELLAQDPENRLLARAPRYRMPSWMIRDSILKSADVLTERTGGPPVFPFQPIGAWKDSTMGRFTYKVSPGKDSYRRSLYTFWRRSVGPTNMFDSSKRRNCSIRAVRTNTPLHALNLMNDSAYVEAAGLLARKSMKNSETLEERIHQMIFKVISRKATTDEIALLKEQYEKSLKLFQADSQAAKQLLNIGQLQNGVSNDKPAELAALFCVAQTILNLDEAINRE
ncbi:MAG: PSD1 and planctomycete cytochrome C domain-containing protein [Lentisphaeraceae bacterium]|nr:PSD1 and planctomycete cytochrome C domain-containing protein [Lentisphaeraceae bacterium]